MRAAADAGCLINYKFVLNLWWNKNGKGHTHMYAHTLTQDLQSQIHNPNSTASPQPQV